MMEKRIAILTKQPHQYQRSLKQRLKQNNKKTPNIRKSHREDSVQPEQTLHGDSCLASGKFGKLNYKTPIWNDKGDESDYQLDNFNARRKLENKESQSVASETEPGRHLNTFQPVHNPKPKGKD